MSETKTHSILVIIKQNILVLIILFPSYIIFKKVKVTQCTLEVIV